MPLRPLRLCVALSGGFFILDRIFKHLTLSAWRQPALLNRFLGWLPFHNPGVAFGLPLPNTVVVVATLPILALLIVALQKKLRARAPLGQLCALCCLIAGAGSNFLDRLFYHATIDYLLIFTGVFNLADFLIVAGLLWYMLGAGTKHPPT